MQFRNLPVICNAEAVAACCTLSLYWLSCFCRSFLESGSKTTLKTSLSTSLHLPSIWSNLSQMIEFVYDVNVPTLIGTLPASWAALTNLSHVVLPGNSLSGSLPMEWSNMTQLAIVDLSNNKLSWSLPESWSGLKNLRLLNLANNTFTNSIPATWSSLKIE